jgi:tetratricopeptide (TPR) repeat protein
VARAWPASPIRRAHAAIAHAMERYDIVDPERMVVHYSGAGDGMRAGETAVQAAHAAAKKLAFNRAAELYSKGIELLTRSAPTRRELYVHWGDALANAGRGAQAAEAYLKAADGAEPGEARKMQRMAAQQYLRSGRIEEGTQLARAVLQHVEVTLPSGTAGAMRAILWNQLRLQIQGIRHAPRKQRLGSALDVERLETIGSVFREWSVVDPLLGAVLQSKFLLDAQKYGDASQLLQAQAFQAYNLALMGDDDNRSRVEALLHKVRELSTAIDTPHARATWMLAVAACRMWSGRFQDALAPAREAETLFRDQCAGASFERSFAATVRYGSLEQTGDLNELARDASDLSRDAQDRDDRFATGLLILSLPLAHLMRDDAAAALDVLEHGRSRLTGDAFTSFHHLTMNRTVDTLLFAGRGSEALDYLSVQWPGFSQSLSARTKFFAAGSRYLRARCLLAAYAQTGDAALLARCQKDATYLLQSRVTYATVLGSIIQAGTAMASGDVPGARQWTSKVVSLAPTVQMDRFALYAQYRMAMISPSDSEHAATAAVARTSLEKQGIRNVDRWVATYFPAPCQPAR